MRLLMGHGDVYLHFIHGLFLYHFQKNEENPDLKIFITYF